MTVREIKAATCGYDENNKSKCVTVSGAHIYSLQDPEAAPTVLLEKVTLEPAAELIVHGNFCTIDLKFEKETSSSLGDIFQCLEQYLKACEDNTERQEAASFITLIPYELEGEYYINAVNPIFWSLEPDMIGGQFRTLRVVFYADDVMFNEADSDLNILSAVMGEKTDEEEGTDLDPYGDYDYNDESTIRNAQFSNADNYMSNYGEEEDEGETDEEDLYD